MEEYLSKVLEITDIDSSLRISNTASFVVTQNDHKASEWSKKKRGNSQSKQPNINMV